MRAFSQTRIDTDTLDLSRYNLPTRSVCEYKLTVEVQSR
ncbi:MAG: hypothetical protein QOC96_401 [Acidobacteriota bacterium]|jgi:hypothetical protein|nr:hypothetical protein [Acidobacteriota bacterium]